MVEYAIKQIKTWNASTVEPALVITSVKQSHVM